MAAADLSSLIKTVETLTATNATLSQKLLEHDALLLEHQAMKQTVDALEAEASDARADKAALEQEMRLSSAQRSAKRATFLIFHLPFSVGFIFFFVGHICLFLVFGKIWRTHTWVPGMVILAAFSVQCMSIRPTNLQVIRTAACIMGIPAELPPVFLGFGVWIFLGFYEPWRYHARPIAYALSLSLCLEIPMLLLMVLTVFKGAAGEAAQLTGLERQKLTWRWMRETFNPKRTTTGHIKAVLAMVFLGPFVGPFTWQKYCEMPMPPRMIMNKFILVNRMCWHFTWGACHVGVPLYYMLLDDDLLMLPPWFNATGATESEIAVEADKTRRELYGTIGSGVFFLLCAFVLLTPLVRGKVHAWLCQLGSAGEAGRAAGVAALVGKMEPQHALVLARKRFVGLPYSSLQPSDFSSNADTGLNGKIRRCRLGGVDAFLSHSWHDSPSNKWLVLEDWATRFIASSARDPMLWFDKACIFQQGNIDEQLACLPIFLSGCQRLVVLAGPTWHERIWCIMELFTFIKMGGSSDRVDLLPVSSSEEQQGGGGGNSSVVRALHSSADGKKQQMTPRADPSLVAAQHVPPSEVAEAAGVAPEEEEEEEAEDEVEEVAIAGEERGGGGGGDGSHHGTLEEVVARFEQFDVETAKCTKEADKQHLLGVIETGFGELAVFNSLVRSLFTSSDVLERHHGGGGAIADHNSKSPTGKQRPDLVRGYTVKRVNRHAGDKVMPK